LISKPEYLCLKRSKIIEIIPKTETANFGILDMSRLSTRDKKLQIPIIMGSK